MAARTSKKSTKKEVAEEPVEGTVSEEDVSTQPEEQSKSDNESTQQVPDKPVKPVDTKPVAKPVKPVDTKPVAKQVGKAATPDFLTVDDVAALLKDPETTLVNKLEKIAATAYPELAALAGVLLSYEKDLMSTNPLMSETYGASKNYNLYNIIKQSLKTADSKLFKIKMDIISLAFIAFGNSNFGEFNLTKYDYSWKQSAKALSTYQNLILVFTMLANKATREDNRTKINLKAAIDSSTTEITPEMGDRLKAYFAQ